MDKYNTLEHSKTPGKLKVAIFYTLASTLVLSQNSVSGNLSSIDCEANRTHAFL
jgi:hypothetical protein